MRFIHILLSAVAAPVLAQLRSDEVSPRSSVFLVRKDERIQVPGVKSTSPIYERDGNGVYINTVNTQEAQLLAEEATWEPAVAFPGAEVGKVYTAVQLLVPTKSSSVPSVNNTDLSTAFLSFIQPWLEVQNGSTTLAAWSQPILQYAEPADASSVEYAVILLLFFQPDPLRYHEYYKPQLQEMATNLTARVGFNISAWLDDASLVDLAGTDAEILKKTSTTNTSKRSNSSEEKSSLPGTTDSGIRLRPRGVVSNSSLTTSQSEIAKSSETTTSGSAVTTASDALNAYHEHSRPWTVTSEPLSTAYLTSTVYVTESTTDDTHGPMTTTSIDPASTDTSSTSSVLSWTSTTTTTTTLDPVTTTPPSSTITQTSTRTRTTTCTTSRFTTTTTTPASTSSITNPAPTGLTVLTFSVSPSILLGAAATGSSNTTNTTTSTTSSTSTNGVAGLDDISVRAVFTALLLFGVVLGLEHWV